jgi:membrane protein
LIAAGVAFFAFFALFPGLIALVSLYGAFTDPADIGTHLSSLRGLIPAEAQELLVEQLRQVTTTTEGVLGASAALGLLVALWSANKGTKALFDGLNIAYDEEGSRGVLKQNALSLLFTLGIAVGMAVALAVIVGLAALGRILAGPPLLVFVLGAVGWILLVVLLMAGLALLYKYAPVRTNPKLSWVSVGAVAAMMLWLLGSAAFSFYVANFAGYGETYGSLAAIMIFLLWLYLSAYAVLMGAEINAESEHQTTFDTTIGEYRPMGERGAYHADHVAQIRRNP